MATTETLKFGDKKPMSTNEMANDRTAMAADRTLMAWTRTSISMISFGFTIYKILDSAAKAGMPMTINPNGPRNLGLLLIGVGTFSLSLGMIEHWQTMRRLGRKPRRKLLNPSFLTSVVILLLGALLFVTIITRFEVF